MFRLVKILNGRINQGEPMKLPTTPSEVYSAGEALVLTNGNLTKCGESVKPEYIACADYTAPGDDSGMLHVEPISSEMIFEVPVSVAPSGLVVGELVTIAADALQVTNETTNGVAKIFNLNGATAAGDTILVRF